MSSNLGPQDQRILKKEIVKQAKKEVKYNMKLDP